MDGLAAGRRGEGAAILYCTVLYYTVPAGRRGEGAAVGGVLGRVSRHQGGLGQPPEPNLQYSTV